MSDIEFRPEFESVVNVANKNYTDLQNKPSINGHELEGNKSSSDLGIATKVSELENDENFQENVIETISVNDTPLVPEEKAVNINVPVNVSELENDAEYITDDDVPVKSISVNSTPVEPDEEGNVDIEIEEPEVPVKSISVNSTPISPDGQGNVDITVPEGLPSVKSVDDGKLLQVKKVGNDYVWEKAPKPKYIAGGSCGSENYLGTIVIGNTSVDIRTSFTDIYYTGIYVDSTGKIEYNQDKTIGDIIAECYGAISNPAIFFDYDYDGGNEEMPSSDPLYPFVAEGQSPFRIVANDTDNAVLILTAYRWDDSDLYQAFIIFKNPWDYEEATVNVVVKKIT